MASPDSCWACGKRALIRLKDGRAICALCFVEGLRARTAEFERMTEASRQRRTHTPAAEEPRQRRSA